VNQTVRVSCGPTGCVARGARVSTPKGTLPIEELGVGDEVLCGDPQTGALHVTRVRRVHQVKRECVRLVFSGGELNLTSDHPVYCPEDGSWSPAGDWVLGQRVSLAVQSAERLVVGQLARFERYVGVHDVYELTVDHPLHNFIAEGILVHNGCAPNSEEAG
jgi:hypothetical protein